MNSRGPDFKFPRPFLVYEFNEEDALRKIRNQLDEVPKACFNLLKYLWWVDMGFEGDILPGWKYFHRSSSARHHA